MAKMSRREVAKSQTQITKTETIYMSDEDGMLSLDGFIAYLKEAWQQAGRPSYGEIERISEKLYKSTKASGMRVEVLPRSTIQEILAGHRRQPPRWPRVASLWAVLRLTAERSGIDPACLGTLLDWKVKHDAVMAVYEADRGTGTTTDSRSSLSTRSETGHPSGPGHAPLSPQVRVCTEQDFQDDPVLAMMRQRIGTELWTDYQEAIPGWLGPYLSLEQAASQIRTHNVEVLPDLLQTEQYANEALLLDPYKIPQAGASRLVELHMRRLQLLLQPDAPRLWAIIDETALHRRLGGPRVMRTQLEHLIDLAEQPNIIIQILPFNSSAYSAPHGPITLLRFHQQSLPDVVYIEQLDSALYIHHPDETARYRIALSRLGSEALRPTDSAVFLHQILREI
jgi:hypothetical protein